MLSIRLLAIALLGLAAPVLAAAGIVDTSFGVGGTLATIPNLSLFERRDGKGFYAYGGPKILKLSAVGAIEPNFTGIIPVVPTDAIIDGQKRPVTVQLSFLGEDSRGRVMLKGFTLDERYEVDDSGGFLMGIFARLNQDGSLDTTFGEGGILKVRGFTTSERDDCRGGVFYSRLAVDDADTFLVGTRSMAIGEGDFDSGYRVIAGWECPVIAKVTETGLDSAFGTNGWISNPVRGLASVEGVSLSPGGDLVVAGFTSATRASGGALLADDRAFYSWRVGRDGRSVSEVATTQVPQPSAPMTDQRILLWVHGTLGWAGVARYLQGPSEVLAFDVDGQPIREFGQNGRVQFIPPTQSFNIDAVGRTGEGGVWLLGSRLGSYSNNSGGAVYFCRWLADGSPDANVGAGGCAGVPTSIKNARLIDNLALLDGSVIATVYTPDYSTWQVGPTFPMRLKASPDVVEFHNTTLDHYFYAYDGGEAKGIDQGAAGPGWERTGQRFTSGGSRPTCRFYGAPGSGLNSHFFTADPTECAAVKHLPMWQYEGEGFFSTPVGECAPGQKAIYRLYNNRREQNDDNHRFVTDLSLSPPMIARGWIQEGVAFCVRP